MIVSWSSFTRSLSNPDMVQLNSHLKIFFSKKISFWECVLIWEFSAVYALKWERRWLEVCQCSSTVILSYRVGQNTLFMQGVCGQDIQLGAMMSKTQSIGHIHGHTLLDGYVPKNSIGGGPPMCYVGFLTKDV